MKKGEATRQKMIEATGRLLQKRGYHGTGLNQIIAESGAPKGSLYFHFPKGKEELACAALAQAGKGWRTRIDDVIDAAPDLSMAIGQVCESLAATLEASNFEDGCPIATTALEVVNVDCVRETCGDSFRAWQADIEGHLAGVGVPEAHRPMLATLILSSVEGALMLARTYRDATPLRQVGAALSALAPKG